MAKDKPKPEASQEINVQQHNFCGKTCEIKLAALPKDSPEEKQPYFGLNFYQIKLQRDVWVRVPVEMANHIETIMYTERQPHPEFPDDDSKYILVERQRFPHQRRD